jgi:uncharacterized protein
VNGQTGEVSDLASLLTLQHVDTAIDQGRHRRTHLPEATAAKAARDALSAAEVKLAALTATKEADEAEQATHEHRIEEYNARIVEIDRRTKIVSVPKELQALSTERDGLVNRRSEAEDRELEVMERLEAVSAEIDALNVVIADARAANDTATIALAEAQVAVDSDLARLAQERNDAVAQVPAALLATYESMRPKLGGVAVAQLEHGHCTGCRLQLPASEIDRIKHQAADEIVTCEQCGRILVR